MALFVGAFVIWNTFSIMIGQRTRELALLRALGAGRGQVFRSVLAEAALPSAPSPRSRERRWASRWPRAWPRCCPAFGLSLPVSGLVCRPPAAGRWPCGTGLVTTVAAALAPA